MGDVDGDVDLDVVSVNQCSDTLSVLLAAGTTPPPPSRRTATAHPGGVGDGS
ncbi:MAG: hypothetical protein ABIX10_01815 [Acidimicrobiales bacterium]